MNHLNNLPPCIIKYIISYLDIKTIIHFAITNKTFYKKYYPTEKACLLKNKLEQLKKICIENIGSLQHCISNHSNYIDSLCVCQEYPMCDHCSPSDLCNWDKKYYCSSCESNCQICNTNCIPKTGICNICTGGICYKCDQTIDVWEEYCIDDWHDVYICKSCCVINRHCKICYKIKCPICLPLSETVCKNCLEVK
jgi:hypothetical protein